MGLGIFALYLFTRNKEVQLAGQTAGDVYGGYAGQANGFANAMINLAQSAANTTSQLVNDVRGAAQQKRDNDLRDYQARNDAINEMYRNNPLMNSLF